MLKINESIKKPVLFSQKEVDIFSVIMDDHNPIHTREYFLSHPEQRGVIVHGMMAASKFGMVLGSEFPGPGTINIERSFTFMRPVFVGRPYSFIVTLKKVDPVLHQAELKLCIKDNDNKTCVLGRTLVKNSVVFTEEYYGIQAG